MSQDLQTVDTLDASPFRHFITTIGNLPTSFTESMSYYEMLAWFCDYLQNTVIPAINNNAEAVKELQDLYIELHDYVENYFENLDVQEEINNKLDAMAESGELTELINHIYETTSFNITPEYILTRYTECATSYEFDSTLPSEIEGICYIGNDKVIIFLSPQGNGISDTTDCVIEEFNISTPSNPTRIRTSTLSGLQHANSCVYHNGKIYVTPAQYYNGGATVYTNTIVQIDYETLTVDDTYVISDLQRVTNLAFNDNKFYSIYNSKLYEIDLSDGSATEKVTLNINGTYQGFEIRNGCIYLMQPYPYRITIYNLTNGNYLKAININPFDNYGHFAEYCSDLSFIDDNTLLITPHSGGDLTNASSKYQWANYINYICKINLSGNNTQSTNREGDRVVEYITVNTDSPTNYYYAIGTNSYPLRVLREYLRCEGRNKYNYRIEVTSSWLECKGILILENENLYSRVRIKCYGLYLLGSILFCPNLSNYQRKLYIRGSELGCEYLSQYATDVDNEIRNSIINCPNINTGSGTNRIPITVYSSQLCRWENTYIMRDECPNTFLTGTIDATTEDQVTVDFSDKITTSNLNPVNYLVAVSLTSGETITHTRTYGVGSNQYEYDHSGNSYQFMTYTQSTHKMIIKSSNYENINAVTMIIL